VAGVTNSGKGGESPPQTPHVIVEAKPGVSEAQFLWDVDRWQALSERYGTLMDALTNLHTATGLSDLKRAATVMALVQFLLADMPSASLALVLDLLPPQQAQRHNELVRGLVAAAVAVLRSTAMENLQIERWLDEEIKRRPALNFRTGNAMRWFFDCNSGKAPVPRGMLEAFRFFFHREPSPSLTESEAKKRAVNMLDTAAALKAGPLTRPPRRRGL
jgi:hypothetical protein